MYQPYPQYLFEQIDENRVFTHSWYVGGCRYECDQCEHMCSGYEPLYTHWIDNDTKYLKPTYTERLFLDHIGDLKLNTFFLCDRSPFYTITSQFLKKEGDSRITQLLRLLYSEADRLIVKIAFYAEIFEDVIKFGSVELNIDHHFDIGDSVKALFATLLRKIRSHLKRHYGRWYSQCAIKRIEINVKKFVAEQQRSYEMKLPLQYEVKRAHKMVDNQKEVKGNDNKAQITAAYLRHLNDIAADDSVRLPNSFNANLYTFQVCPLTKELFVVPFHLQNGENIEDSENNYIIMENIVGQFQHLLEIENVKKFLVHDYSLGYTFCNYCLAKFKKEKTLRLHQKLKCGKGITVEEVSKETMNHLNKVMQLLPVNDEVVLYGAYS